MPQYPALALVLQQDFAAVGIELEMIPYPVGEFYSQARAKEAPGLYLIVNAAVPEPDVMIVAHYQRAGFIYLTEIFASHVTAANIEWPLGAAQIAWHFSFHQINKLKT